MVSLGPLTTTFTPAPSCVASFSTNFKLPGGWDIMGPISTDDCFPPNYAFATNAFYSPGICPSGYTAACVFLAPGESVTDQVTTATCCPTGYTCNPTPQVLSDSTYFCNSRISDFVGVQASMSGSQTLATSTDFTIDATQDWIANAFGVQIRYKATDFASSTSSPSKSQTSSATSPPTTSAPSRTASDSVPSNSSTGGSGGLSTGAAAGVGVGVTIGALLIIAAILFAVRARRRRIRNTAPRDGTFYASTSAPCQIESKNMPSELPGEVKQVRQAGELEGRMVRGHQR